MAFSDLLPNVDATTIGATVSGAMSGGVLGGLIGFGSSVMMNAETAKKMKALKAQIANMPKWKIPKEYLQAVEMYDRLSTGMMPSYNLAQENIATSGANLMSDIDKSSSTSAGGTEAKLKGFSAIQDSYDKLGLQQIGYQETARDKKIIAEQALNDQRMQQFNMNEVAPWKYNTEILADDLTKSRQKSDVAMTQVMSSIPEFADSASSLFPGMKGGTSKVLFGS